MPDACAAGCYFVHYACRHPEAHGPGPLPTEFRPLLRSRREQAIFNQRLAVLCRAETRKCR